MSEFMNIMLPQSALQFVPYSGTTSMSEAAKQSGAFTGPHMGPQMGPNMRSHIESDHGIKEGFTATELGTLWTTLTSGSSASKYDMSGTLFNFPIGHPMYAPQTLAEVRTNDTESMLKQESAILGMALVGGISVLVLGLLVSQGFTS